MLTEREKFIAIVNNDIVSQADAIILLEGDGFNRYRHAARLYNQGIATKIVFSGGIVDYDYGSYPFNDIEPLLLNEGVAVKDIIHENISLNTREQAVQIIKLADERKWKRLILVASPEHQYRAYLTFLKEILRTKMDIVLFNSSANNLKWFENSNWGIRFERLDQEFTRIEKYSSLGHLATYSEAIDYQKWKELQ